MLFLRGFLSNMTGFFLLLAAALCGSAAAAESDDARFLDGLRHRGMFPLAESHCRRQLRRDDLSPLQRAELVIELSRCYTQHAVHSPPDPAKRDPLWQQALQVTEQFTRTHRNHPRLLLVDTQGALSLVVRGELARQEAEVLPNSAKRLATARDQLLRAIVRLKEIEAIVSDQSTREPRASQLAAGALDRFELLSLKRNINYQLARALRNQAFCYRAGTADRANALNQALERLRPVAESTDTSDLVWRARIDQMVCLRLQGQLATANLHLAKLAKDQPPTWVKLRLQAERIRVLLARGELDQAITRVNKGHQVDGPSSAELDFAHIEAYLAAASAAQKAGRKDDVQQWQQRAEAQIRRIESRHGPYWTRRADTLLGRLIGSSGTGSLRSLAKLAARFYHGKQFDQAVAAYDRAWRQAKVEGNAGEQFRLASAAAAIEQQRQNLSEARDRFRALATSLRTHPDAARVHLQAIYLAAQIAGSGGQDEFKIYAALIDQHLQAWSDSPTAEEAHWHLGRMRARKRDWRRAIEAFKFLKADHPRYARAVGDTADCYRLWIAETKAAGRPALARRAVKYFEEQVIYGPNGRLPEQWSPAARQAALSAAGLWLYEIGGGYRQAEPLLTAALDGSPGAPDEWKSKMQSLLVFSLAGQGKREEANRTLQKISSGNPAELLDLLTGLSRIATGSDADVRGQLAALQLDALKQLGPRWEKLTKRQQRQASQIDAAAKAAAGHHQAAHDAYQKLSQNFPNDGAIQEDQAMFLVSSAQLLVSSEEQEKWLKQARAKWHSIERRSKPASARWFRAKYFQALANERLGNKRQAAKIIKLLQVLHPQLGGTKMQEQFLALLKRCQ